MRAYRRPNDGANTLRRSPRCQPRVDGAGHCKHRYPLLWRDASDWNDCTHRHQCKKRRQLTHCRHRSRPDLADGGLGGGTSCRRHSVGGALCHIDVRRVEYGRVARVCAFASISFALSRDLVGGVRTHRGRRSHRCSRGGLDSSLLNLYLSHL